MTATPTHLVQDRPADHPAPVPEPTDDPVAVPAPKAPDAARPVASRIRVTADARAVEGLSAFTHGPGSPRRRALLSTLLVIAVIAAISGIVLAIGDLDARAFRLLLLFDAAFFILTLSTGINRTIRSAWTAIRSPLLSMQILAVGLSLVFLAGVDLASMRGLLEIGIGTGVVLAALRLAMHVIFHPRVVAVTTHGEPGPASPRDRARIYAVVDAADASQADLVEATIRAVDRVHADVVRVDGNMSPEALTQLSWGLRSREIPLQLDLIAGTVTPSRVVATERGGGSLLVAPPQPSLLTHGIKRAMDILGSAFLIFLLSPLLIVTAIAVKATDGGPIIYRQERVGMDGEPFGIFKFRTMAVDADARLQQLLREQKTDGTPLFKVQNDPRLTRIGSFLRRYSIDELPQLFNVLLGTMSLVGPRPQRDAEVALYTGTADHRLGVRPGMTGLWQVSGRSNLSWEEARRLDVFYAHNWSIGLDLSIFLRTFKAVLGKDGAY